MASSSNTNDNEPDQDELERERERELERGRRQLERGRLAKLTEKLAGGPERPGEQKIARSPAVMLLVGSTIGAALLAAIFWYINGRNKEQRLLQEAMGFLADQKYLDAEDKFTNFLKLYPKTASTPVATIGLHRTLIEKYIMTTTPDVAKGLEAIQTCRKECAELPGFADERTRMYDYAERLTFAGARVAELSQDQKPLEISREAMLILRSYAPEGGVPPEDEQRLVNLQRVAEAAVAKKQDFQSTVATIASQLESGNTLGAIDTREKLLKKYPLLATDKDVVKALQDILAREREFVVRTDLGRDALGPDASAVPTPSVALTLRTQAATDLTSQGRRIFAIGIDSCFAVDADTGVPLWRVSIGSDSPFLPVSMTGTSGSGVLVFNTLTNELQCLAQDDGRLLWRQPCDGAPSGPPLLTSDAAWITTTQNELMQVSLSNGRAIAKLKFPQRVIGPPAVSNDGKWLVLPGDQTLVYTLTTSPLACAAVSQIPHDAGSVGAPVLTSGRYFLLFDNYQAAQARIQTLEIAESGELQVVASDYVDGQMHDPAMLRGSSLFVPSTPQRVTAFRVNDSPGQPPLALVGANQLEEGVQTAMFLLPGPGEQVWLAGRDLRKFEGKPNSLDLEDSVTAEGIHLRPIQSSDQDLFLTTGLPASSSVFLTRADREQMKGIWRTVLGSRIVALAAASGGQSLLAVADYGESFRVNLGELSKGGFVQESISRFRLPEKLKSAVSGLVLLDGRPAAWCGGEEPAMWTFTTTGQLERRWPLPGAPLADVPPVALTAGVVFALPGRLHMSGTAGGAVSDYQSAKTAGNEQSWKALTALSPTQLLAVSADNQFVRVDYRATPRPQLAEVGVTAFPHDVEVAPAAADGFVSVVTTEGKLLLLQAASLEVLAEADLGGLSSTSPAMVGGLIFVDVANEQTRVFRMDDMLTPVAALPLDGSTLAGPPLRLPDGGFLVARSDGLLVLLDQDGVPAGPRRVLGQRLQFAPQLLNGVIVVAGQDGSLYQIDPGLGQ